MAPTKNGKHNSSELIWTNVRVRLGDLKPWDENPRMSTKKEAQRILESFKKFGQAQVILIGPDNEVYDGHQRLSALLTVYGESYEVDARRSSRALSEDERKEFVITIHTGATGEYDFDILSGWETDILVSGGFDDDYLKRINTEAAALGELFASMNPEDEGEDDYTAKIEAPIYTPKGRKPKLHELYDDTRTRGLIAEINASQLPEDEKEFLRMAAHRHTVINFKAVAEYYAHADSTAQFHMENSALVIIDFARAIQLGYVKLSRETAMLYRKDHGGAQNGQA